MIKEFHRPKTVNEALAMKHEFGEKAAYLAGGIFINSKDCPQKPEHIINLEGVLSKEILDQKDGTHIGALCSLQTLIENDLMPRQLKNVVMKTSHRNIRNQATIGGHIAANDSVSDLLPTLVALQAKVIVESMTGKKETLIEDFVSSPTDGIVESVVIPAQNKPRKIFSGDFRRSAGSRAVLVCAVSFDLSDDNVVTNSIIAVGGVAKHVVRLSAVENVLNGKSLSMRDELEKMVAKEVLPIEDIHCTQEFKKYQVGVMVGKMINDAEQG